MRITIDLPDELFRRAQARAMLDGIKLKDLITRFVEQGLGQSALQSEVPLRRRRSELPVARAATGRTLPALTNADIHRSLEEEDAPVSLGFDTFDPSRALSHGSRDLSRETKDTPHGSPDAPHGSRDVSRVTMDRSSGSLDPSRASGDRPRGWRDTSHGSWNVSHGTMDTSRPTLDRSRGS